MFRINGTATDPEPSVGFRDDREVVTAEQVARVVAGIPAIGHACEALRAAGWQASIAANRITVDDEVFAVLIGATPGEHGSIESRWVVYRIAGTPPVWIVGAEGAPEDNTDPDFRAPAGTGSAGCGRSTTRRLLTASLPRTHVREWR